MNTNEIRSINIETKDLAGLVRKYEDEYNEIKLKSPEEAESYLLKKLDKISLHLGNEALADEFKKLSADDVKYIEDGLLKFAEKEGVNVYFEKAA